MIPPLIIRSALENHINLIAITDHNHTANIAAVQKAAAGTEWLCCPEWKFRPVKKFMFVPVRYTRTGT
jgi:predicted metal-dependent phosphoesterase TrpH